MPSASPLHYVLLPGGRTSPLYQESVPEAVLTVVAPWWPSAVASRQPARIPGVSRDYTVRIADRSHELLLTVMGPPRRPRRAIPIATLGVVRDGRHPQLWHSLMRRTGSRRRLPEPSAPWAALAVYLAARVTYPETQWWLQDFAWAVAWLWLGNDTMDPAVGGS